MRERNHAVHRMFAVFRAPACAAFHSVPQSGHAVNSRGLQDATVRGVPGSSARLKPTLLRASLQALHIRVRLLFICIVSGPV